MAHPDPAQIRNVAVLGHRGSGKTSLVEAMLFAAGETNRLGTVAEGTTVADFDDDERRRTMSISASLCHLEWGGVKINLIDTPGEPSFQGESLTALRAVNAALLVLNATAGVEVQTERLWSRATELGLPRAAVVNMLDRERADFDATVAALKELAPGAVAIQVPIGSEAGFRGIVNLVSMTATTYDGGAPGGLHRAVPRRPRRRGPVGPRGAHRRGGRERRRADREVPRGRGDHDRGAHRGDPRRGQGGADLPGGLRGGGAGDRRRPRPRPHRRGPALAGRRGAAARRPTPTRARPSRSGWRRTGRSPPCASRPWPTSSAAASTSCGWSRARSRATATRPACRTGGKERVGQLFTLQGKDHVAAAGDRARRHRRRRQAQGGRDRGRAHDRPAGRLPGGRRSRRRS